MKKLYLIISLIFPLTLLLLQCKSSVASDEKDIKSYYIANKGSSELWFTETNAQEVVVIENDIITFYYRFAPDSVCYEGGPIKGWCEIKEVGKNTLLIESGDTAIVRVWTKGNPPWPNMVHVPDC